MVLDKSVVSRVERDKTKGHVKLAEMGSKQGRASLGEVFSCFVKFKFHLTRPHMVLFR